MKLRKDISDLIDLYNGGCLAVPSVPGAGKTTLLTHLTFHILKTQPNSRILIVTYMNSAVANFKQRINDLLKGGGIHSSNYDVMTLHALASSVIGSNPAVLGLAKDYEILSETDTAEILKESIKAWLSTNTDLFYSKLFIKESTPPSRVEKNKVRYLKEFTSDVSKAISMFKGDNITPSELLAYTGSLPEDSYLRWAADIYDIYEDRLRLRGAIDFGDLLMLAYRLLTSDREILSQFQDKWDYVFEDEAQDSNKLQNEIMNLISNYGNLVRVGDPNQAILSTFTIADPKQFTDFIMYNKTKEIKTSGRSSLEIIRLANHLVESSLSMAELSPVKGALENQMIKPAGCENPQNPKYGVGYYEPENLDKEYEYIAVLTKKYLELHPDKTCAILLRTNNQVKNMMEVLQDRGIESMEVSNYSSINTVTKQINCCLKFINRPEVSDNLIDVLRYVLAPEIKSVHTINLFMHDCRTEDLLYPMDKVPSLPDGVTKQEGNYFYGALTKARELLSAGNMRIDKLIIYILDLIKADGDDRAIGEAIAEEARRRLYDPGWKIENVIDELSSSQNRYSDLVNIFYQRKGFTARPGQAMVLTYHKAKGLEWDNVFMGCVEAADFPLLLSHNFMGETWYLKDEWRNPSALIEAEYKNLTGKKLDPDFKKQAKLNIIAENLRLLYVGITRAKQTLIITGHKNGFYDRPLDNRIFEKIFGDFINKERSSWMI